MGVEKASATRIGWSRGFFLFLSVCALRGQWRGHVWGVVGWSRGTLQYVCVCWLAGEREPLMFAADGARARFFCPRRRRRSSVGGGERLGAFMCRPRPANGRRFAEPPRAPSHSTMTTRQGSWGRGPGCCRWGAALRGRLAATTADVDSATARSSSRLRATPLSLFFDNLPVTPLVQQQQ